MKAGQVQIDEVKWSFSDIPAARKLRAAQAQNHRNERHHAADGRQRLRPLMRAIRLF
jgi:hypothetical protein